MAKGKKSQKKGDETLVDIVEVRDQAQSFMDQNQNLVFGALVALVLMVGGFFAYNNFYVTPRQQEAVRQMYQAQIQFERDSFARALTNPGGGFMGFLDIIENYGGTKAANLANYYSGVAYLNLGQYEAAVEYLEDYKPDGSITPIMKYGALGDAYAELDDFDEAMSYYKRAAGAKENQMLTPYYLKKVGLLHERNGDFQAAREAYEEIKEKYPNSPVGSDIEKYIVRASK